jgi:NAD(P)-dependent dehydrogenase (short-subunit alcohol dehydrogenase family)
MTDIAEIFPSITPRYPELAGQVAVVTGASKGIGKGIAARLGREGMKVVVNARTASEVEAVVAALQEQGVAATGIVADVGTRQGVETLVHGTLSSFGTIDLLVNNAAALKRLAFFDVSLEMFESQLAANLSGPFLASLLAAQVMKEKGKGAIVHISSVGGLRAHNPGLPYDATKGALDAMTRVMGVELAPYNIRVNAIAPGATWTERRPPQDDPRMADYLKRIPLNRMGTPLEIGAAVAFLASDDAAYIIGQVLYVDGGITAQLSPPQYPV